MQTFLSIKNSTTNKNNITLYDTAKLKPHEDWQYNIYIIMLHLDKILDGDILVYYKNQLNIDKLREQSSIIFEKINRDIIFPVENPTLFLNKAADTTIMSVLGENTDYYKNYFLLNTDIIFIRKTNISVKFINELYNYYIHYNVLGIKSDYDKIITSILYRKYIKDYSFDNTYNLHITDSKKNININYIENLPFVNSFDIFDTIATRNLINPTDLHDIIEKEYPFPKFKEYRIQAENKNGVTLNTIYNEFKILTGISDDEIEKLKAYEIKAEIDNLYLITSNYNQIDNNDILISDMYLNSEQLKYILTNIGYKKNNIIFSSSCGLSKKNGTMYKFIQNKYNIKVHMGDNFHSDIINADKNNIKPLYTNIHKLNKVEEFFIRNNFKDFGLMLRKFRLMNPYPLNSLNSRLYMDQATYNIPLLILISQNINNIMIKENRDTLLCLTRDGCLLEHIFKLLYPHYKCKKYYSSRKLHLNYNDEYIEYIKTNYDHDKCIMFDGHGSFKSGRELYNKVFGYLPRIFIFCYDLKADLYDGFSFGCSLINDFEHMNSDIESSIICMKDGKFIRDNLEYNIENALIYKNTIIEFCNFIKNKNIEEMPCELLKEFANSFVIISSIIYNTPQEGTPLKDYLQANNIDINKWIASKSAI